MHLWENDAVLLSVNGEQIHQDSKSAWSQSIEQLYVLGSILTYSRLRIYSAQYETRFNVLTTYFELYVYIYLLVPVSSRLHTWFQWLRSTAHRWTFPVPKACVPCGQQITNTTRYSKYFILWDHIMGKTFHDRCYDVLLRFSTSALWYCRVLNIIWMIEKISDFST